MIGLAVSRMVAADLPRILSLAGLFPPRERAFAIRPANGLIRATVLVHLPRDWGVVKLPQYGRPMARRVRRGFCRQQQAGVEYRGKAECRPVFL